MQLGTCTRTRTRLPTILIPKPVPGYQYSYPYPYPGAILILGTNTRTHTRTNTCTHTRTHISAQLGTHTGTHTGTQSMVLKPTPVPVPMFQLSLLPVPIPKGWYLYPYPGTNTFTLTHTRVPVLVPVPVPIFGTQLQLCHNMGLRINCSGAFRTSVENLYVDTHQLPLDLRCEELGLRYLMRIKCNPGNPSNKVICQPDASRFRPRSSTPFQTRLDKSVNDVTLRPRIFLKLPFQSFTLAHT